MGGDQSKNLRNVDKRTARRENKQTFIQAIDNFRKFPPLVDLSLFSQDSNSNINIYVRKRPIFQQELDSQEFDSITCHNDDQIFLHDARLHSDMKNKFIRHHHFKFNRVFDESSSNKKVFDETTQPLIEKILNAGGIGTIFMYGQTGSGKTYTMTALCRDSIDFIFNHFSQYRNDESTLNPFCVVSFLEVAGEHCFDLLRERDPVTLRSHPTQDPSVNIFRSPQLRRERVSSREELLAWYERGREVRHTRATAVNDQSSRSHSILRIEIYTPVTRPSASTSLSSSSPPTPPSAIILSPPDHSSVSVSLIGCLSLVDLAGSETSLDSRSHDQDRRKEAAQINSSLMALREVLRSLPSSSPPLPSPPFSSHRSSGDWHYIFRKSKLTMALKEALVPHHPPPLHLSSDSSSHLSLSPSPPDSSLNHEEIDEESKDPQRHEKEVEMREEVTLRREEDPSPISPMTSSSDPALPVYISVLCTVSPSSKDSDHSLSSLSQSLLMTHTPSNPLPTLSSSPTSIEGETISPPISLPLSCFPSTNLPSDSRFVSQFFLPSSLILPSSDPLSSSSSFVGLIGVHREDLGRGVEVGGGLGLGLEEGNSGTITCTSNGHQQKQKNFLKRGGGRNVGGAGRNLSGREKIICPQDEKYLNRRHNTNLKERDNGRIFEK